MGAVAGTAFNVGGGSENALSLLELIDLIAELSGRRPSVRFAAERAGDQRWYVSDTTRLGDAIGWNPRVNVREGVETLYRWLAERHAAPRTGARAGARAR
jgi:CDP-paratose 2-epimerase